MPTSLSKRQLFNFFRMGLVTGLVDKESLIAWADREIMAEAVPDHRVIELALSERRSYSQIIWLLRGFQEEPDHDLPLKLILALAGLVVERDPGCSDEIIMGLRLLNEEEYLPRSVHEQTAALLESLTLHRQGRLSFAALQSKLAVFLAPYLVYRPLLDHVL